MRAQRQIAVTALLGTAMLLGGLFPGGCEKKQQIPYPDLSNPKAAAVTFTRAMERDDVKVALDSAVAGGMEVELVEALAHASFALKHLVQSTRARFGEEAAGLLRGSVPLDTSVSLEAGEVTVDDGDGTRATVTPQDGRISVPVQRTDEGVWKVDVGALIRGDDITRSIPVLRVVAAALKDVTAQVDAGKFQKMEEVKAAFQLRVYELSSQARGPTTMPTTMPTTSPASAPTSLPAT